MLGRLIGEDIELVAILGEAAQINADAGQIEQVLMNLAVNARDAMPRGGKLTIETSRVEIDERCAKTQIGVQPGSYVLLAVTDTGTGMDAETLKHIFEPFFTTKEQGKGTGLGLSTVYGIVKQSGGNIWLYSEPNEGTVFKIYLPRVNDLDVGVATVAKAPSIRGGTETVLIVEDDAQIQQLVLEVLAEKGYDVLVSSNGLEALQLLSNRSAPLDLILTDVVMPQMSGRELAERAASIKPNTKVLFMSGYTNDAIVRHGVLDSGTWFIQKPFAADALAARVREVLDGDKLLEKGPAAQGKSYSSDSCHGPDSGEPTKAATDLPTKQIA
jgi:two-component system cell cycle sensor histidine kinase/response regulator CckA